MKVAIKSTSHFDANGFTFTELLVVVATVALLAVTVLPALAKAKLRSTLDGCLNNQKQFAMASIMFSGDHGDYLISASQANSTSDNLFSWRIEPMNLSGAPTTVPAGQSSQTFYDSYGFQSGGLYPYIKNSSVVHCPADARYLGSVSPGWCSYSMVDNMNGTTALVSGTDYRLHKLSQIKNPNARIDINEENDPRSEIAPNGSTVYENLGSWDPYKPGNSSGSDAPSPTVNPKFSQMRNGGTTGWWDGPAAFHGTGSTFSFCDGHAEFHKWRDSNTLAFALSASLNKSTGPYSYAGAGFNGSPNDLTWLYSHIATSVWQ